MSEIIYRHREFCAEAHTFQGFTKSTLDGIRSSMKQFIKFSNIQTLEEFSTPTIKEWVMAGKLEREWSPKTIRIHLCYLGLFAKWCVANEHLEKNPVDPIPRPRLEKKLPVCLSEDEAETLMEWVKNYRYYYKQERARAVAIFALFLGTGIRKTELRELRVNDVDIEECCVHVRLGKGQKGRTVPFHPSLAAVLDTYLKQRDRLKRHCPYFFLSLKKDAQMSPNALKRLMEKIRDKSGLPITAHVLRHTYATVMLQRGLDVREVQELLGHSSINSTVIYLSVIVGRLREQVRSKGMMF